MGTNSCAKAFAPFHEAPFDQRGATLRREQAERREGRRALLG
jgi:hypothetical protein